MSTALLQFEIDLKRVRAYPHHNSLTEGSPVWKYEMLLIAALKDTLKNGGTFVVVASETKLTAVQRSDTEDL